MKKFSVITLLLLAATLVLVACDGALPSVDIEADQSEEEAQPYPVDETGEAQADAGGVEKTIYVGPEMVECEGEGPQQCLLVKEDPNGEYTLHYFPIQGFVFEPGYEYELIVREETVDNPPAGGSSLTWTLVEEVSRTPVDGAVDEGTETASGRIVTAFVGPQLVDCVGVAPQQCLQYKTSPDEDYRLFYDQIEGFEFEEGFEYELSVLVEPVENPPADASALRYTLIEMISKEPAAAEQAVAGGTEAAAPATLEGPTWLLESYVDPAGQAAQTLPDTRVTIEFADGQVSGTAGCNSYSGSYEVDGNILSIGPLASTMMACVSNEVMAQETAYLATLGQVAAYEIVDGQLQLLNADGQPIAVYNEDQTRSLTGTVWQALGYNNGAGGVQSLVIDSEITAVFREAGVVSGSAGCNDYRAGYEVDGNNITINPAAVTRKICPEPEGVMEQESLYLAAVETAATYEIDGAELQLYTSDGARVAYFTAAGEAPEASGAPDAAASVDMPMVAGGDEAAAAYPTEADASASEAQPTDSQAEQEVLPGADADDLAGTSWRWLSMITPVEEVTVDDPSVYLLNFLEDGQINIQSDCNSGSGTYEADDGALSINITSTTLALCPEGSLSDLFIRSLNAAAIYFDLDGNLHIDLFADAGTMIFAPN